MDWSATCQTLKTNHPKKKLRPRSSAPKFAILKIPIDTACRRTRSHRRGHPQALAHPRRQRARHPEVPPDAALANYHETAGAPKEALPRELIYAAITAEENFQNRHAKFQDRYPQRPTTPLENSDPLPRPQSPVPTNPRRKPPPKVFGCFFPKK